MERGRCLTSPVKGWQLFRSSRGAILDERKNRAEKDGNACKPVWKKWQTQNEIWRELARRLRPPQVRLFLFQETRRR